MSDCAKNLPTSFCDVLLSYLKRTYLKKGRGDAPWDDRDTRYFSKGIVELNAAFTHTRGTKAFNYFNDPVMRSGYLAYFLPVNAMKGYALLAPHVRNLAPNLRIADIGAGPLTLTFSFLFCLADLVAKSGRKMAVQVDAYEQNAKILSDGRAILREFLKASGLDRTLSVHVVEHAGPFRTHLKSRAGYDFILAGNILNEFDERGDQSKLALDVLKRFSKPDTLAFFIEPGSKKFTRDLQALRDAVIANTKFRVIAPCLHQEICPLNLTAKSDWCNFSQRWRAPDFIRDFDAITELKKAYLLYSYLVLRNGEVPEYAANEFVAISDLMPQKGRFEIVGCGPAGRVRFMRSHRDATPSNAAFASLSRGAQFTMVDFAAPDRIILNENVPVRAKDRVVKES